MKTTFVFLNNSKIKIKVLLILNICVKIVFNKRKGFSVMKAVVTVTGKDKVGIIAMASAECAKYGANIIDISQSVLDEYFAMIMLVSIDKLTVKFAEFADKLQETGKENGVDIRVMHEDIFNTMHRI